MSDLPQTIETEADILAGARWLAAREPRFAAALATAGPPPLRRGSDGFLPLAGIVVAQRVSVASARAVQARLEAAGLRDEATLEALADGALRACGLSAAKVRCLRAIAAAKLDYEWLRSAPEAEAIEALTAVPGVGRWTADVYLMFCVGRRDVFAPGDLALREGARLLFGLVERPSAEALGEMAEAWSPWRAVAARLLWAYYAHAKGREGVAP